MSMSFPDALNISYVLGDMITVSVECEDGQTISSATCVSNGTTGTWRLDPRLTQCNISSLKTITETYTNTGIFCIYLFSVRE